MKHISIILIGAIFTVNNSSAQVEWEQTTIPPNGSVYAMEKIGSNLFAGTSSGGLYFSSDDGTNWVQRNGGFLGMEVKAFAVDGTDLYIGRGGGMGGGIYKSSNNGITWTNITPSIMGSGGNVMSLATDGTNIYAGTQAGGGIFKSALAGISPTSWTTFNSGLTSMDVLALKISGSIIYAGTYGGGVFTSPTGSASWSSTSGMSTSGKYIRSLCVKDSNMFAGNVSGTPVLYRSSDYGLNWTQSDTYIFYNKPVLAIVNDGNTIYAGTEGEGAFFSNDNGISWAEFNEGFQDISGAWFCTQINIRSFVIKGSTLFAGTDCGVWKRSLSPVSVNELNENSSPVFYPNPAKENIIVKVTNDLLGSPYFIYDQLGRMVLTGKFVNEAVSINIGQLSMGMYTCKIGVLKHHSFRFVKE